MLGKKVAVLLCVLVAGALLGCSSDDDSNSCTVTPSAGTASADGKVTYTASVEGNGSVASVVYTADAKPVTVKSPSLPFMVTVDVKADEPIGLTVTGSASGGGKVVAGYAFVDAAGSDPVVTNAECSH